MVASIPAWGTPRPELTSTTEPREEADSPRVRVIVDTERPPEPLLEEFSDRHREADSIKPEYQLPADIKPPIEPTRAGGSRGCPQAPVDLTLLAPAGEMASTISGYPTFYWYTSEPIALPVLFTLVEQGGKAALFEEYILHHRAGLNRFQLPSHTQALKIGKEYQWSVSLVCNPERPSANIVGRAWIQRVQTPDQLAADSAREGATSEFDSGACVACQALASAGIWYDALAAFLSDQLEIPSNWENLWNTIIANVHSDVDVQ
ncbi:MAG: DUF928 domain-containing protein [Cyanophyceae cyanobacterium]